jgi:hypothetical protein
MTHYTKAYKADKRTNDVQALRDMQEYMTEKHWTYFQDTFMAFGPQDKVTYSTLKVWLHAIDFACMMVGVSGYPVRAFKRTFLSQFKI